MAKVTLSDPDTGPFCRQTVIDELVKRADRGDKDAQYELGRLILMNHCIEGDRDAAIGRLKEAAGQGHIESAVILAQVFSDGDPDAVDLAQTRFYLLAAAKGGHVQSQHYVGLMLLKGDGGKAEQGAGLFWLGSAASEGHALSALILGWLHESGDYGVSKNLCLARDWYEASQMLGMPDAKQYLIRVDQRAECF